VAAAEYLDSIWPEAPNGPVEGNFWSEIVYDYSATYSPNPDNPPFYVDLPMAWPSGELIQEAWDRWLSFDPVVNAHDRLDNLRKLTGILLDAGRNDDYNLHWGHRLLSHHLSEAGIQHDHRENPATMAAGQTSDTRSPWNGFRRTSTETSADERRPVSPGSAARAFMVAFPDLRVLMDDLLMHGDKPEYRWTLVGTNTGPGGTGRRLRISGFEEWSIGSDGLIASSLGHYDQAEYERQLDQGVEEPYGL
jgi:hypothetical protein